ncbi:hypothetical protein EMA8858_00222 [Emticicia aquatica]|jgi:hypothetical protein|uniref:Uncharacterized protein n=1 Tax=Emticicia aquatica TaxID=1681835 RepID=A0ABM9AK64_9BACT|nr:hypothetical protein [Emticicia aquatica]CAH0994115.1 hypothetical protein EMA8858_00222 [Emticicia aquatica]
MTSHSNENTILDDVNSPELDQKIMSQVAGDFIKVADHLKEASYQIRKRGFSENPIFVVARTMVEVGQMLFTRLDFETQFDYKASFLDEFVQRKLIGEESVELFKENFKNADEYCCLFVIEAEFAGFVFIPFPED